MQAEAAGRRCVHSVGIAPTAVEVAAGVTAKYCGVLARPFRPYVFSCG